MEQAFKTRNSQENQWEWPFVVQPVMMAVALPLIVYQFQDAAMVRAVHLTGDDIRGIVIDCLNRSGLVLFGITSAFMAWRGLQGAYLSVFGFIVATLIMINSRSDYIRPGTFDFWDEPRSIWLSPNLGGLFCGLLMGLILSKKFSKKQACQWRRCSFIWPIAIAGAAGESWWSSVHAPDNEWSSFAPSRPLVLAVVAGILGAVYISGAMSQGEM